MLARPFVIFGSPKRSLPVQLSGPGAPQQSDKAQHREDHAHVLAHQQEQQTSDDETSVVATVQPVQGDGEQRNTEGDLVEVEIDHALDGPAQRVAERQQNREAPVPEMPSEQPRHDGDRRRHQRSLCQQQHAWVVPDPVQRRQHRQDRVEVVTQDVVAVALERHQRRLEVGVVVHRLVEDAQVITSRQVLAPARERIDGVDDEERQSHECSCAPVSRGHSGDCSQPHAIVRKLNAIRLLTTSVARHPFVSPQRCGH